MHTYRKLADDMWIGLFGEPPAVLRTTDNETDAMVRLHYLNGGEVPTHVFVHLIDKGA